MEEAKIVKNQDGELRLENFYTPLEEAKKEVWRRWKDRELKQKVEKFWNGDVPEFLKDKPKAYLARHINTPDKEFFRFLELARKIGLQPVCPELLSDKFLAKNSDKYYLGKLFFYNGKGKNGGDKISTLRIIDFNNSEGKRISDLKTIWGENLVDFHHTILKAAFPEMEGKNPNMSVWFSRKKKTLNDFYRYFLSFFLCHAILLESFVTQGEKTLLSESVLPQFNWLQDKFGVKPLIVRLLPENRESQQIWCCHPEFVKKLLKVMVAL